MPQKNIYLTIHGHFYQPPRENPWLEAIERQDSAAPFKDWNERINVECYDPNSVSKIVDDKNQVIDIVNNYSYMSYNFGPTLMSWMQTHAPLTYERIIKADAKSAGEHNGHGNALAQVYNHMIMPLANTQDKYTQTIWGIRDFEYRFGRKPEGIWLAETAVDDETLLVLANEGIKFTVLSPYQADKFRDMGSNNWNDVSWGNIDPARPYRYYIKSNPEKYVDLFFYDGTISRSVAFEELLRDGNKFARRLQDGISNSRNFPQLVNIATDGESYGHHTKFGDMALAYILKVGARELGFEITNYAQFLENYPPQYEVDIKPVSAWSCAHGVGRWMDDCGCSTGALPHWNQKWRKPLRQALDYLRDELINLCTAQGTKYFKDFWQARNNYIDVILDRSEKNVNSFFKQNAKKTLKPEEKVKAIKLLEIQRFSQLMYTSCGWFFADISGIETTQIMKYAYRAMELAGEFSKTNYEKTFLSILQKAKSNILEFGNGKDIFNNWVKPSAVGFEKIAAQCAIESSFSQAGEKETKLYCYKIKKGLAKKYIEEDNVLTFGKMEVSSEITFEKKEISYVVLQTQDYEFYCSIKEFCCADDFNLERKEILKVFKKGNVIETLQAIETYFGSKFYSLKDIPMDRRKNILENMISNKLQQAAQTYEDMYEGLLHPISHLNDLGMDIPEGFRVCAKYTLLSKLEDELNDVKDYEDKHKLHRLFKIRQLADKFNIKLNTPKISLILSNNLSELINALQNKTSLKNAKEMLYFFELLEKLKIETEISDAQNIFYKMFCSDFEKLFEKINRQNGDSTRELFLKLLEIGKRLNINVEFYREKIDKLTGKV